MTEQFTTDAEIRYAFAPNPEPVDGMLYCANVIFEEPDGRLWSTDTDRMAPNLETAKGIADRLNTPLGWKTDPGWPSPTASLTERRCKILWRLRSSGSGYRPACHLGGARSELPAPRWGSLNGPPCIQTFACNQGDQFCE